jgi:NADH oxidase (H2O-forming)
MEPLEIKKDIHWVGVLNPELRVFDVVMYTQWGTTYNSYLVKGEKTAVIEVVKAGYFEEFHNRLKTLTDPTQIDYIICNHTEPDHTGSLAQLLEIAPQAQVVGSQTAINFLKAITNREFSSIVVKDGDTLDLGGKELKFISAPFLHWPDSQFTYVPQDKVLFTCDAFGCHYTEGDKLFDDQVGNYEEAQRYYYDVIMSPFKEKVVEAINKIKGLDIEVIAPSHGPILRKDPWKVVDLYAQWSTEEIVRGPKRVFIGYASAYGYTRKIAEAMAKGIEDKGLHVDLYDVSIVDQAEVFKKIEAAQGILLGSPTLNRDVIKPVWEVLVGISVIRNKGKLAGAFGSYGWSGEAVKIIEERLKNLQLKVLEPGIRINFQPSEANLAECREYGQRFAEALLLKG